MRTEQTILRLRHRLQRWELEHLRALAVAQAEEIERLRAELAWAHQAADAAEQVAEVCRIMRDEPGAYTPVLLRDGRITLVPAEAH